MVYLIVAPSINQIYLFSAIAEIVNKQGASYQTVNICSLASTFSLIFRFQEANFFLPFY